jgi:hypothetical protein
MPTKTTYRKKKPGRLIIESDDDEIKPNKKKIIIEKTTPVSQEEFIMVKKPTKKVKIRGDPKNKTRRNPNIKKRRLLIVESDNTEKV